jgi:hypothetical protein
MAAVLLLPLAIAAGRVTVDRSFFASTTTSATLTTTQATTQAVEPNPDCGNWQISYKKMHESMLRGEIPAKYAIASGGSGLAGERI